MLFQTEIHLPANAQNIHALILEETGLAWDNWWVVMDKILAPVGERQLGIYGWSRVCHDSPRQHGRSQLLWARFG